MVIECLVTQINSRAVSHHMLIMFRAIYYLLFKMKTKDYALDFLMKIKERHSQMEKLHYKNSELLER